MIPIPALPGSVATSVANLNLELDTGVSLPELPALLNRTVLNGGKKLRPALCFLMGDLFRVPAERIAPFARIAELLHCATLVHDDVIDAALRRRARPTLNAETSNSRAVLAGDLLLARVIVELAELGNIPILRDLSVALESLVNGEWQQMGARGCLDITRQHLETVARNKTASLMSWCCAVPAQLTEASDEVVALCRRLGDSIGLAFQMKDDRIDFDPANEKGFAQDLREGLVNFLALELVETYPDLRPALEATLGRQDADSWPWSEYQLRVARQQLDDRINATVTDGRVALKELASRIADPNPAVVEAIDDMLRFLSVRTH